MGCWSVFQNSYHTIPLLIELWMCLWSIRNAILAIFTQKKTLKLTPCKSFANLKCYFISFLCSHWYALFKWKIPILFCFFYIPRNSTNTYMNSQKIWNVYLPFRSAYFSQFRHRWQFYRKFEIILPLIVIHQCQISHLVLKKKRLKIIKLIWM